MPGRIEEGSIFCAGRLFAIILRRFGIGVCRDRCFIEAQKGDAMTVDEGLIRLKEGNAMYIAGNNARNISGAYREKLAKEGQHPYAVIVACSDSRVVPEFIFSAGLGELFVIRVAGNIMDDHQLGSVEYALAHLHCTLVVILGHSSCGAVNAAIAGGERGYVGTITGEIACAIGAETDDWKAAAANAEKAAEEIRKALPHMNGIGDAAVMSAMYDLASGRVHFNEEACNEY